MTDEEQLKLQFEAFEVRVDNTMKALKELSSYTRLMQSIHRDVDILDSHCDAGTSAPEEMERTLKEFYSDMKVVFSRLTKATSDHKIKINMGAKH